MNVGRKIRQHYENPIDNVIISFCEYTNPYFKNLKVTPNLLTTFSLIFGLCSSYAIYKTYFAIGAILFFIAYVFDCMDGNYARTYDMVTPFGDWYDHISDTIKFVILIFVILFHTNISKNLKVTFISVFTFLQISVLLHMGCQERIYDSMDNETITSLKFTKKFCPNVDLIKYTRYIGVGTMILCIVCFLFYCEINSLLKSTQHIKN